MPARHIVVTGTVQGVFFRASAKKEADSLGIHGWVRNAKDGSVEIHAEGSDPALDHFIEWCSRGPQTANVHEITVEEADEGVHTEFSIEH